MWKSLGLVASLLIAVSLWIGGQTAFAGERVPIRAGEHKEFGRIVFDWPTPVRYEVDQKGSTVSLRFERPMSTSFEAVARRLTDFVQDIVLSDDGTTVEVTLTAPHRARVLTLGGAVVLDLVRGVAGGSRPAAVDVLTVRTGKHKEFGRLVFDWNARVGFEIARSEDTVAIQFDRPAKIDIPRLWRDLPFPVSAVSAEASERGLKVELAVPAFARLRQFRDGNRVVLDVVASDPRPERTEARAKPRSRSAMARGEPTDTSAPEAELLPTTPTSAANAAGANPRRAAVAPMPVEKVAGKVARPDTVDPSLVKVDVSSSEAGVSLRFNWPSEVAAAVFRRQRTTWIYFAAAARLDLAGVRTQARKAVDRAEQVAAEGATALALNGPSVVPVRMRREGTAWVLDLARASETPTRRESEMLRVEFDSDGLSRLVIAAQSSRGPYGLKDPEVGDMLAVAPVIEPGGVGVAGRRYIDLEVLPSLQGVALRSISETVEIRRERESVVVTSRPGLKVSGANDGEPVKERPPAPPLTDIGNWESATPETFERERLRLIHRVVDAGPRMRTAARAELARFYFAHGLAADALGVAEIVAASGPRLDNEVRAIRGAANYLLGHFAEAAADLDLPELVNEKGVLPWRAAIAGARGDWREAFDLSRGAEAVLAGYPGWLAIRLGAVLTEAALAVDELGTAKKRLEALQAASSSAEEHDHVTLLEGFFFRKAGQVDQAVANWRTLAETGDRFVRARATFAEATTLLAAKRIDSKTAAEKLERLNFAWRGDAFEFDVLRQLGEIYLQMGNPREALSRFRLAATYFENVKGTQVVAARMSELYRKLYLDGEADKLAPVRAVALFDDYRELLPSGPDGEEMIRRLADRLVRVDLLAEAAALLETQVEVRLAGTEKARVGARLASIRLLDRKPLPALAALKASEIADAPPDLALERKLLQARALADLGRSREALAIIEGSSGRVADDLRIAILWRTGSWREAAGILAERYRDPAAVSFEGDTPLEVLRWAIAASLGSDDVAMARLRADFAGPMAKTAQAEPFRAVIGRGADAAADYATLARQAGDVGAFEAFLKSYRERLRSSALSRAD